MNRYGGLADALAGMYTSARPFRSNDVYMQGPRGGSKPGMNAPGYGNARQQGFGQGVGFGQGLAGINAVGGFGNPQPVGSVGAEPQFGSFTGGRPPMGGVSAPAPQLGPMTVPGFGTPAAKPMPIKPGMGDPIEPIDPTRRVTPAGYPPRP